MWVIVRRSIHYTLGQKGEREDKKAPDLANYQKAKKSEGAF
jgi:hypothetical protein